MTTTRKVTLSLLILIAIVAGWLGRSLWVEAGRAPRGERLERIKRSSLWRDGQFVNEELTPQFTGDKGMWQVLYEFLFVKTAGLVPDADIPAVKTDLRALSRHRDVVVWLGHSSVFIQSGGVRYLFDPVLTTGLPVSLFMRPFKGAAVFTPDDIPDVDYLIITHDHWDHLDYKTVKALRERVGRVVCGLGIGEHFEYWGYDAAKIHEMEWGDSLAVNAGTTLHCLPSRHFSGRLTKRNQSLWASYLIDGPQRVFVSGDGGYDARFRRIGERFGHIDLAILENGQYNADWRYIHTLPSQLPREIEELRAARVLTYHNSKYALARHPWREPLDSIAAAATTGRPWQLLTPRIGDPVSLTDTTQSFPRWW